MVALAPALLFASALTRPAAATGREARAPVVSMTAGVISTVAGGVGGPALATTVAISPFDVSFGAGHLYIANSGSVRQVNPATDELTTPAGTGVVGPLGDGGPATRASMATQTRDAVTDRAGNLVVVDGTNDRIRVVAAKTGTFYSQSMKAGDIYTVAGDGTAGYSGDGGPATGAELDFPTGVAVDAVGNLLIAETADSRIRMVATETGTFYDQPMKAGDIYTVAGDGTDGYTGDGVPAISAEIGAPENVAVDAAGNLLIADGDNNRIRVVAARTGTFYDQSMKAGDIYTVAGDGTAGYSGDGGPATSAELNGPMSVSVDATGNLLITDNDRIRVVAAKSATFYSRKMTVGDIYTVAGDGTIGFSGDGGRATSAELTGPWNAIVDSSGNLVISDQGNARIRVVAVKTGTFYGKAMTAGDIYTIAGNGSFRFSGDSGPATGAELDEPLGVTVDPSGNIVFSDTFNERIRVAAATTGTLYGKKMTAGDLYTIAGNGTNGDSGNGGPATSAEVGSPEGLAVDSAGNLLIADTANSKIQVVAAKTATFYGEKMTVGHIYLLAGNGGLGYSGDGGPAASASLNFPADVAVDAAGNVLIADTYNCRIRVVPVKTGTFYGKRMTAEHIYTIAGDGNAGYSGDGGPATSAGLYNPEGVTVDSAGNLVIADTYSNRIRVVAEKTGSFYGKKMTAGHIYTVAGEGRRGYSGDGGAATKAELALPWGIAVDTSGNLVISDNVNERLRIVAVKTGTFYGEKMTAGDIYTVAGDGTAGFSGDGSPAQGGELKYPTAVAVDRAGNLLVADTDNDRIRMVTG